MGTVSYSFSYYYYYIIIIIIIMGYRDINILYIEYFILFQFLNHLFFRSSISFSITYCLFDSWVFIGLHTKSYKLITCSGNVIIKSYIVYIYYYHIRLCISYHTWLVVCSEFPPLGDCGPIRPLSCSQFQFVEAALFSSEIGSDTSGKFIIQQYSC